MKFSNLFFVACLSLGGVFLNPFGVNAGYRNSAGGNVYGDSDLNWKADPNLNWKADPDLNWKADPNLNWKADPNLNWKADPDLNPMGMSDDEF